MSDPKTPLGSSNSGADWGAEPSAAARVAPIAAPAITIRPATRDDAAEIANVHISSWREAYRGLLPAEFLDELPLSFRRRMKMWQQAATRPGAGLFVAEAVGDVDGAVGAGGAIVGFAVATAAQNPRFEGYGEIGAIYLLAKFKGLGHGAELLKTALQWLSAHGLTKAFCWVLESNPTIGFYERLGATFTGIEKSEVIGGQNVKELAYEWTGLG